MLDPEADEIAIEHIAWAHEHGQNALQVMLSIGVRPTADDGPDDAIAHVARRWLMIQRTLAQPVDRATGRRIASPGEADRAAPAQVGAV